MVVLGKKYTDSITGFTGIAMSRTTFLYGCVRVALQPTELHDGKPIDAQYFDEQQVDAGSTVETGGPMDTPPARVCPKR